MDQNFQNQQNSYNNNAPGNGQWTGPTPDQHAPGYNGQQYGPGYQQYSGYGSLEEYYGYNNAFDSSPEGKSRGVAGLLAIFLGGFGVQYFYLGKVTGGLLCILLSLVTCGVWQIVTFIQGIMMLCMNNYTFRQKFVLNPSTMPMF
ncbi:MAG: TM2 domain-containing protein [Muribaculaceae bacterium]|nr:TM2 domain-containing protein [Muribaculaceae bacterium]